MARQANQVALITGAAGLLGPYHAKALLENKATVILSDIDGEALGAVHQHLKHEYPKAQIFQQIMDVTRHDAVQDVQQSLLAQDLAVNILINNASIDAKISTPHQREHLQRVENFSLDQWQQEFQVGLTGTFSCCQVFGSAMAQQQGGTIVNIASDLSVIAPDQRLYQQPDLPASQQPVKPVSYCVIKTAVVGLTRYLAAYWADQGVRVNALSPGGVKHQQTPEFVAKLSEKIPLGRMANVDEYCGTIQFLCSNASAYMTGQNLVVDGGRSII